MQEAVTSSVAFCGGWWTRGSSGEEVRRTGTGAWLSVQLHMQGLCHRSWVKDRAWSAARRMEMQNFPNQVEGLSCMVVSVRMSVSQCSGTFCFVIAPAGTFWVDGWVWDALPLLLKRG